MATTLGGGFNFTSNELVDSRFIITASNERFSFEQAPMLLNLVNTLFLLTLQVMLRTQGGVLSPYQTTTILNPLLLYLQASNQHL